MEKKLNANLTFNPKTQTITILGVATKMTTKESELFDVLSSNINELTGRNVALMKIWGEVNYFNARSMDVYITKLRKILQPLSDIEIMNVHGRGYKLLVDNANDPETV